MTDSADDIAAAVELFDGLIAPHLVEASTDDDARRLATISRGARLLLGGMPAKGRKRLRDFYLQRALEESIATHGVRAARRELKKVLDRFSDFPQPPWKCSSRLHQALALAHLAEPLNPVNGRSGVGKSSLYKLRPNSRKPPSTLERLSRTMTPSKDNRAEDRHR